MGGASPAPCVDLTEQIERQPVNAFVVRLLLLSMLVSFLDGYDLMVMSYAAPYVAAAFELDKPMLGNLFSIGLVGTLFGAILAGYLGDRYGRRPVLVASTAAFGVLTLSLALADSYASLLVLRLIQGVALAGALPLLWALNTDFTPRRRRATVVTLITVGFGLGSALAGPLSVQLAEHFSWHSMFVLGGVASIAASALLFFALPESLLYMHRKGRPVAEIARALKSFAPGISLPAAPRFSVTEAASAPARDSAAFGRLFSGELRWITPLLWTAYFTSSLTAYLFVTWGPMLFEGLGFSRASAAYINSFNGLAGTLGGLMLMRFTDSRGPVSVAVMLAIAFPLMLAVGLITLTPVSFVLLNALCATVLFGGHTGVMSLISPSYPSSMRASGGGWASAVGKLGSIIGPQLGGVLLASSLPPSSVFAVMAICPLIVAASIVGLSLVQRANVLTSALPSARRGASIL